MSGQVICEYLRLVESAVTQACDGEWNGNDRRSFPFDIGRPRESGHSFCHRRPDANPAAILERVDDRGSRSCAHPAVRARRSDERRQELAPAARVPADRMTAPKAPGIRKLATARPAVSANDSGLSGHHQPFARHTTNWKQQIRRGVECRSKPQAAEGQSLPAASSRAFFIADWSGSSPNQH
jgi:hypothetical protein